MSPLEVLHRAGLSRRRFSTSSRRSRGAASRALDIGRQPSLSGRLDAAIFGAASGGLTCGAVLAKHGPQVVVSQQHAGAKDIWLQTPA